MDRAGGPPRAIVDLGGGAFAAPLVPSSPGARGPERPLPALGLGAPHAASALWRPAQRNERNSVSLSPQPAPATPPAPARTPTTPAPLRQPPRLTPQGTGAPPPRPRTQQQHQQHQQQQQQRTLASAYHGALPEA